MFANWKSVPLGSVPPDEHLQKKVDVGGNGAWDYLIYDPTCTVSWCRAERTTLALGFSLDHMAMTSR
jgi:hypothetical protein